MRKLTIWILHHLHQIELEEYKGCYYEEGAEACQKEIDDRHDLADLLLLQTEMQQRYISVLESNLLEVILVPVFILFDISNAS